MPESLPAALFVIVRHGNTFDAGEAPRRIGARTDLPLTQQGAGQADDLGKHFAEKGWHFARALTSPLIRTSETARLILAHQGGAASPKPCGWLREIDHGPDENEPEDRVVARIGPDALEAWDKHAEPPAGWIVDADSRLAAWKDLFSRKEEGPVLIVTSNGAARFALLSSAALCSAAPRLPSLKLPTGSYGVIQRSADGKLDVPVWGKRP